VGVHRAKIVDFSQMATTGRFKTFVIPGLNSLSRLRGRVGEGATAAPQMTAADAAADPMVINEPSLGGSLV
jgi:hypothetical protein